MAGPKAGEGVDVAHATHEPASVATDESLVGTGPAMVEQLASTGRLTPENVAQLILRRPQDRSSIFRALQQRHGNHFVQDVRTVLEGAPERTEEDDAKLDPQKRRDLSDSLQSVTSSFIWLNDSQQQKLEELRADLKRKDEPPLGARVLESLLEIGLGAGAASTGVFLADKVLEAGVRPATHELVKVMFEQGIDSGVAAGRAKIGEGSQEDKVDAFINSQKEGVRAAQHANETAFIHHGRHRVDPDDAKHLEAGLAEHNVRAAGLEQYNASRDAWVSQLAQSKYGAIGPNGPLQEGDVTDGGTTTNMATKQQRTFANKAAPGFEPSAAPNMGDAVFGDAPGVLELKVHLPAIGDDHAMSGEPEVEFALLNGVSNVVRDELAEQCKVAGLGSVHIPRQIVATVEGGADFKLSLDEAGTPSGLSHAQAEWLRRRAVVGHPENAGKSDAERERIGLSFLLRGLAPDAIDGKLSI